ncbi:MAG: hypothetical protein WC869_01075 [Phycisphaerae bacterium]|jgi:hypothetical protein
MVTDIVPAWLAENLAFTGRYTAIPECTKHGLREWVLHAQTPGHFVEAVLCNDMYAAMDRADQDNQDALLLIMTWMKWKCPTEAWLCPSRRRAVQGLDAEREAKTFRDDSREQLYLFKGLLHREAVS